ncbi:malate dehydrogenase [Candidatus Marithrix sp. Canyon 246]|uniref:malate dehydrogenase n=1 Tax=Candidatus Marithrix sp. Canyon 246 TaxID=1827136 RepID=UPI000849F4D3|nr:malate dehydrogenase [Candidatus Marithrix sp. Canyon 246]
MKPPVRIVVTGGAGQIAYSLVFRIASGELFGSDQPIILHLLELPSIIKHLNGVGMELNDCAYPLLYDIIITDDVKTAFTDVEYAFLVGAAPRTKDMQRADLIKANAEIFKVQGKALNNYANSKVKVVVVGNPANTNAYIAMRCAPDLAPEQFTAMTRLDHNRLLHQLANKLQVNVAEINNVIIWGNHSASQYTDIRYATTNVDQNWFINDLMPCVQQRGTSIIEIRGKSSAASAAYAAISHMRDWVKGTDQWVSMAIPSDGSYGIKEGLIYSYPVTIDNGIISIVQGLEIDEFSRKQLDKNQQELELEREAVLTNLTGF